MRARVPLFDLDTINTHTHTRQDERERRWTSNENYSLFRRRWTQCSPLVNEFVHLQNKENRSEETDVLANADEYRRHAIAHLKRKRKQMNNKSVYNKMLFLAQIQSAETTTNTATAAAAVSINNKTWEMVECDTQYVVRNNNSFRVKRRKKNKTKQIIISTSFLVQRVMCRYSVPRNRIWSFPPNMQKVEVQLCNSAVSRVSKVHTNFHFSFHEMMRPSGRPLFTIVNWPSFWSRVAKATHNVY